MGRLYSSLRRSKRPVGVQEKVQGCAGVAKTVRQDGGWVPRLVMLVLASVRPQEQMQQMQYLFNNSMHLTGGRGLFPPLNYVSMPLSQVGTALYNKLQHAAIVRRHKMGKTNRS